MTADGADRRRRRCRPAPAIEWTAMSYQEKIVGNQMYLRVRRWRCCWSISCSPASTRAGSRRSRSSSRCRWRWSGRCRCSTALEDRQQSLYPDRPDPADRAVGQERDPDRRGRARAARRDGKPIVEAAVEAARARFRPILMTSFAFILGVVPLVLATGAGASAPQVDRHHGVQRHDRLDLPRGAVRAVVLRRGAALRGMARRAESQGAGRDPARPRIVTTRSSGRWRAVTTGRMSP